MWDSIVSVPDYCLFVCFAVQRRHAFPTVILPYILPCAKSNVLNCRIMGVRTFDAMVSPVVSYWRKYAHIALVNRLGLSLPKNSMSMLTDGSFHVPLVPSYLKNHE